MKITTREACAADDPFLRDLYGSTRAGEMAAWGWGREQREQFLAMQYTAREQHYRVMYKERDDRVILRDGRPVGRLIVARRSTEFVLVDIALFPNEQGQGLGEALVRDLQREAAAAALPLRLHVLNSSAAAIRFYMRLDFKTVDDDGSYLLMEWRRRQEDTTDA